MNQSWKPTISRRVNLNEATRKNNWALKFLGLAWDKRRDTVGVTFPDVQPAAPTKRSILGAIAKIYDPLGLVSPVTLAGKTLYREECDLSIGWDKPQPEC
jgi:hypothetical protein